MRTIHISPEFPLNRRMRRAVRRGKLRVVREGGERLSLGGGMAVESGRAFRAFSSPLVCMVDRGEESERVGVAPHRAGDGAPLDYVADELRRHGMMASPTQPPSGHQILSVTGASNGEILVWVRSRQTADGTKLNMAGQEVDFDFLVILTNFHPETRPEIYILTSDEVRRLRHKEPRGRYVLRKRDHPASPEEGWEKLRG